MATKKVFNHGDRVTTFEIGNHSIGKYNEFHEIRITQTDHPGDRERVVELYYDNHQFHINDVAVMEHYLPIFLKFLKGVPELLKVPKGRRKK